MIAIILICEIINGNLKKWIISINHPGSNSSSIESYPANSVIKNYGSAFEWEEGMKPFADIYDPKNKTGQRYLYYGSSTISRNWINKCCNEDINYNQNHKLDAKYLGYNKFNPDKLVNIGETFSRKYVCVKNTVNSIQIIDSLKTCDSRYFTTAGQGLRQYLSDNYILENTNIMDILDKTVNNQNICYVRIQITLESESEWVQEVVISPSLCFLEKNDDFLTVSPDFYCTIRPDNNPYVNIITFNSSGVLPIYNDLGYFDTSLPNSEEIEQMTYPMRKGERVTYNLIYVLPAAYLDDAYLVYNDTCTFCASLQDYTYNSKEVKIIKLTN